MANIVWWIVNTWCGIVGHSRWGQAHPQLLH
jgi:hypothetical protein